MRLRTWLLTGSSLTLLTLSPFAATAQDAAPELPQECVDAGYTTLEDCIAAQPAEGETESTEETAPAEETTPAEDAVEEPEAEAPPVEEAPAEEVVEEPAQAQEAAPVEPPQDIAPEVTEEQVTPAPEETQPEAAPEPEVPEEVAPEPQIAPEGLQQETVPEAETTGEPDASQTEQGTSDEAAPVTTQEAEPVEETGSDPVTQAPAVEQQQAPAAGTEVQTQDQPQEAQQTPDVDISAELAAEVDAYNAAVADILSGGDAATAQAQISQAQQNISSLCSGAGFADVETCLQTYGLTLPAVPNLPQPETEQAPAAQPSEGDAQLSTDARVSSDVPVEPVEELPEGITQDQVAPVLDSAKGAAVPTDGTAAPAQAAPTEAEAAAAAAPIEPPPVSDAAAQSRFIASEDVQPVSQEEGQRVEAAAALEPEAVPQNVTIVNQTNVVNNVTNNTTVNNTTTNIDQSQTNIGEQTNIEVNQNNQVNNIDITQTILQVGTELIVRSQGQDTDRFYNADEDEIFYENLSNGRTRETITRPDGTQIITVRNRNGDILRRSRIDPAGREYVLAYFDEQYDEDLIEWRDPAEDLPPLRLNISVQEYVLDASDADEEEVETFFRQPPVEQVARLYSIDEVKRSARVRDSVRKLEIGGLTFDTGAATISRDQVGALSSVANGMLALLEQNPTETFLIEGHTDAVGSDVSNLQLSDLRAATVARILTDFYDVPPENLATQGYGERYLKIRTEASERENRRVTVRRITPLVTVAQQ